MSNYKRLISHVKKTLQTAEDNGMSINSDIERLKWELDVLDRADEVFKDYYTDKVFDLVLGKEEKEEENA